MIQTPLLSKPTFRWSFSQWEAYHTCPQKWKFKSILKLPTAPPGPAAARGLSMHDRVDRYIQGQIDVETLVNGNPGERFGDKKPAIIHPKYVPMLDEFKNHPNGDRSTENKLAFDADWSLCGPKNPNAACIAIIDAHRFGGATNTIRKIGYDKDILVHYDKTLRIGEWKSGKPKDTHGDQRALYSLVGWLAWPISVDVEVTTYYLEDTAPPVRLKTVRADQVKLKAKWQQRIELMQSDQMCAPRPGEHCNWCDFAKRKGGPCQFGN